MSKKDFSRFIEMPYKLYNADAGGLKMNLKRIGRPNIFGSLFYLIDKQCPHDTLYMVRFQFEMNIILIKTGEDVETILPMPQEFLNNDIDIWMTWINNEICLGVKNKKIFTYPRNITGGNSANKFIGYVVFSTLYGYVWTALESPFAYNMPPIKDISGGNLHWVTIEDNKLPLNAMIGGFEKKPIYIARAMYSGSLCPGKYVPEERKAYVAWGGHEHEKSNFQILCGYNAKWVQCSSDNIPENAFMAGTSEVHNGPLYIGRAYVDYKLLVGKVHVLYKKCYLPYNGEEVETTHYEILVDLSIKPKGYPCKGKCKINVLKDQICI